MSPILNRGMVMLIAKGGPAQPVEPSATLGVVRLVDDRLSKPEMAASKDQALTRRALEPPISVSPRERRSGPVACLRQGSEDPPREDPSSLWTMN